MAEVAWDAKMVRILTWLEGVSLPAVDSLQVDEGEEVTDLEKYRQSLVREARRGKACPRAAYGGLQRDILVFRSALLEHEFGQKMGEARTLIELRRAGEELAPLVKAGAINPEGVKRLQKVYRSFAEMVKVPQPAPAREL